MKQLNVYFKCGVHPQFKEITEFPPEGVNYKINMPSGSHNNNLMRKRRGLAHKLHEIVCIPRFAYVPNADKYDLIHSTRGFIVLNRKPWIVDAETAAAFSGLNWVALRKPMMQLMIRRGLSSKYCKKVLPQSEAAKNNVLKYINCKGFEDKIEVLYPAYRTNPGKRSKSDKVRISFVGKYFLPKGGYDLQKAFVELDKKYDVELLMKSDVPEKFRLNMPNVRYLGNELSKEDFYKTVFFGADIYAQPTYVDSYGIAMLEAMSTGLPIVTTDDFTMPELVINGKNGFTVHSDIVWDKFIDENPRLDKFYRLVRYQEHPDVVKQLVEKLSILIENSALRKRMGRESFRMVESGKFSIPYRNKQLRRIYEETIRN